MKALFLTQYPHIAPSPRYRVYQMVPYLESQGIECDVVSMISEAEYLKSRQSGSWAWKSALMGKAFVRRLNLIRLAKQYDLIYVLKGAFLYGPPIIERLLKRTGVPIVFDFDDAIHIHKPSIHNRIADWLKYRQRVPKTIGLADQIIVPNSYLADYSRQFNANVTVVPEAEDTDRLVPRGPHENREKIVIGWVGSSSTVKYLKLITPALQEICRKYPQVVLRVIGGHYEAVNVRVEHVEWSMSKEVKLFHGLDIGIMPLPLEEWSKGKSGCKLRQYMSTGVPGVATDIGYNQELVQNCETGILVKSTQEWVSALSQLIESPHLRNQLAQLARTSVESRFGIPIVGSQLLSALHNVVQSRHICTKRMTESMGTDKMDDMNAV